MHDNPENHLVRLRTSYPFLTFLEYTDGPVLGLMQNETPRLFMLYSVAEIREREMLCTFLDLCNRWWERTDNTVPIETYIGRTFDVFRGCLRGYSKKGTARIVGPTVSVHRKAIGKIVKDDATKYDVTPPRGND